MPTVTRLVNIVNNNPLCLAGVEIPLNCELFHPVEYDYFVIASNTIPDGCGGFLEVGTRIKENQTIGYTLGDDWAKLLHIVSQENSYWIAGTIEEWKATCICSADKDWVGVAVGDKTTPITTFADQLLFYTPTAMSVSDVMASLEIAQSGGAVFTIDIKANGVSIFVTPLTIANTDLISWTSADLAVTTIAAKAMVTCSVTQVGSGDAAGLIIYFVK